MDLAVISWIFTIGLLGIIILIIVTLVHSRVERLLKPIQKDIEELKKDMKELKEKILS